MARRLFSCPRALFWLLLLTGLAGLILLWVNPTWLSSLRRVFSNESIDEIAAYLRGFGIWTPTISILLMILQAVIAPLPSTLVAGANGILYGVWWGTLLSWIGNMAGVMTSFWMARWLGARLVHRFIPVQYHRQIDHLGAQHGFWIVLAARLTPIISLDFIGYLAGLSRMSTKAYLLANAIGITPAMVAYTILGHDLARAEGSVWRTSLTLLGGLLIFLGGRWWLQRRGFLPEQRKTERDL